jgi:hypothetical protein
MKPIGLTELFKQRKTDLNVAIGIPSMGTWHAEFAIALQNMMSAFVHFRVAQYKTQKCQVVSQRGSILPRMRFHAVKQALEMDATHMLWIDSDHTFPRKMLHALLEHNLDVVGINHVTKKLPAGPTARLKGTDGLGVPVYTNDKAPSLQKVWRLGCGTMLVKMGVYRKIGPAVFDCFYNPVIDDYQGEDWTMCEAMENAGFDIWVDHRISDECGHVGMLEFRHSMVETPKEPLTDVLRQIELVGGTHG